MSALAVAWTEDGETRRVPVPPDGVLVIGRDPSCDIVLDDATVSRRHAEVVSRGDECYVRPLSATNATYVNGRIVVRETRLAAGDELWLPVRLMRVVAAEESP